MEDYFKKVLMESIDSKSMIFYIKYFIIFTTIKDSNVKDSEENNEDLYEKEYIESKKIY